MPRGDPRRPGIPRQPQDPQPAGRSARGTRGPSQPGCLSLCRETIEELARAIEQRLLTSKGIQTAGPLTCSQPATGRDLDLVARSIQPGSSVGDEVVLLEGSPGGRIWIVKGIGLEVIQRASSKINGDPANDMAWRLQLDGQVVQPYSELWPMFGTGLRALASLQLVVRPGQTVSIIVRRRAVSVGVSWFLGARLKGWEVIPTAETGRDSDLVAY